MFPDVALAISQDEPTPSLMITIKYFAIILFVFFYELIIYVVRKLTRKTNSPLEKRKRVLYSQNLEKGLNQLGMNIKLQISDPIRSISRVHFEAQYL